MGEGERNIRQSLLSPSNIQLSNALGGGNYSTQGIFRSSSLKFNRDWTIDFCINLHQHWAKNLQIKKYLCNNLLAICPNPYVFPNMIFLYVQHIGVFPKCFNEFAEFSNKIFVITVKGLESATSCVGDQDATTARVIYQIPWINWIHWILPYLGKSPLSFPMLNDHIVHV